MFKFTILILVLGVAGCNQTAPQNSVAGILMENPIATTKLKSHLDQNDAGIALRAELKTLKYGRSGVVEPWQNAKTGNSGEVVAGQPYKIGDRDCRRYQHAIRTNGIEQKASGTACLNENNRWVGLEPIT